MKSITKSTSPWLVAPLALVMIYSFSMFIIMLLPAEGLTASPSDINVTIGYGVVFGITALAVFMTWQRLR